RRETSPNRIVITPAVSAVTAATWVKPSEWCSTSLLPLRMIGLRMTMYAIATKVTSPPRTSRENVDPLLVISKNESTRFRKVGLGADFVVSVVVTRLLYRREGIHRAFFLSRLRERPDVGPHGASAEIVGEHDGLIVLLVLGRVHERDGRVRGDDLTQFLRRRVVVELGAIPRGELLEFLRVVPEPGAQLVARPDLLEPEVDGSSLFRDPARPESIDQYPIAVAGFRMLVHAFDIHGHTSIVALLAEGGVASPQQLWSGPDCAPGAGRCRDGLTCWRGERNRGSRECAWRCEREQGIRPADTAHARGLGDGRIPRRPVRGDRDARRSPSQGSRGAAHRMG